MELAEAAAKRMELAAIAKIEAEKQVQVLRRNSAGSYTGSNEGEAIERVKERLADMETEKANELDKLLPDAEPVFDPQTHAKLILRAAKDWKGKLGGSGGIGSDKALEVFLP